MITDPVRACQAMLGQTIEGIHIKDDLVTITCSRGVITFDAELGELYIEVEDRQ